MDVGSLVVADAQAAKLVQPRKRSLDHPAPPTQAASVLGGSHGQPPHDVTCSETTSNRSGVVAAIAEH